MAKTLCNHCGQTKRIPRSHRSSGRLTLRMRIYKWFHRNKPKRFILRDMATFEAEMTAARRERDALESLYQQARVRIHALEADRGA